MARLIEETSVECAGGDHRHCGRMRDKFTAPLNPRDGDPRLNIIGGYMYRCPCECHQRADQRADKETSHG